MWTEIPGFWPVASPLDCTSWPEFFVLTFWLNHLLGFWCWFHSWILSLGPSLFLFSIQLKIVSLYTLCPVQASGIPVFWVPTCLRGEFWQDSAKCPVLSSHYNKNCLAKWFQWKLQWEYCFRLSYWVILAQYFFLDKKEVRTHVSELGLSMGLWWDRPPELLVKAEYHLTEYPATSKIKKPNCWDDQPASLQGWPKGNNPGSR